MVLGQLNKFTYGVVLVAGVLSSEAYARRGDNRDGFNFGTSVRILSEEQTRQTTDGQVSQTVNTHQAGPYVGCAFWGLFNLGVSTTIESTQLVTTTSTSSAKQTETQDGLMTGGSVFGRLLFGKIMFLEVSAGLFKGTVSTTTDKTQGESKYSGSSTTTKSSGVGPGYQLGLGVEVPMGVGFFFTGEYAYRTVELKDYLDNSTLGNTKSEVLFGIAHYLQ